MAPHAQRKPHAADDHSGGAAQGVVDLPGGTRLESRCVFAHRRVQERLPGLCGSCQTQARHTARVYALAERTMSASHEMTVVIVKMSLNQEE